MAEGNSNIRRSTLSTEEVLLLYDDYPNLFSLQIHHGGRLTHPPNRVYIGGTVDFVDLIDIDRFSIHELDLMLNEICYSATEIMVYQFPNLTNNLDNGLEELGCYADVLNLKKYVSENKLIYVYTLNGAKNIQEFYQSPSKPTLRIEEIDEIGPFALVPVARNLFPIKDPNPLVNPLPNTSENPTFENPASENPTSEMEFEAYVEQMEQMEVDDGNANEEANEGNHMEVDEGIPNEEADEIEGRDKPIISAVEYISEYLMRRIVTVMKVQEKHQGLLAPYETKLLEKIKKDATHYHVLWNGGELYQVSGRPNHHGVVDLEKKTCSCRRWELTGIPCCHGVAAIWCLATNGGRVGALESWVNPIYSMDRWKKVYSYRINPINGRNMWVKTNVLNTLTPPKHHTLVGRPKKARKRFAIEAEEMAQSGKLSKKNTQGTCGKCGGKDHNRRTCKGQGQVGSSDTAAGEGSSAGNG